jgi:hypothetical protein
VIIRSAQRLITPSADCSYSRLNARKYPVARSAVDEYSEPGAGIGYFEFCGELRRKKLNAQPISWDLLVPLNKQWRARQGQTIESVMIGKHGPAKIMTLVVEREHGIAYRVGMQLEVDEGTWMEHVNVESEWLVLG